MFCVFLFWCFGGFFERGGVMLWVVVFVVIWCAFVCFLIVFCV